MSETGCCGPECCGDEPAVATIARSVSTATATVAADEALRDEVRAKYGAAAQRAAAGESEPGDPAPPRYGGGARTLLAFSPADRASNADAAITA